MINACRTFLIDRLRALTLLDGFTHPYFADTPEVPGNIFFEELPLDYLKDHEYAACCLPLQDRSKKNGKLIASRRTLLPLPKYDLTRRRYTRELIYRCLLYAPTAEDLWGDGFHTGLAEQLQQGIVAHKRIADSDKSCIRIEPQDLARPWDSGVELERKLRRSRLAIVRVLFSGGLQTIETQQIIPDITITPLVS